MVELFSSASLTPYKTPFKAPHADAWALSLTPLLLKMWITWRTFDHAGSLARQRRGKGHAGGIAAFAAVGSRQ